MQHLGQADISLLKKNELRDRLAGIRKSFEKYLKDKEAAANKAVRPLNLCPYLQRSLTYSFTLAMQAVEALQQFFKDKPDEPAYFATLDVNANAKVMQGVVLQAKKLGKSIYIFSADVESGKVAHVNAVSEAAKAKGVDGREWASAVVAILGGKVSPALPNLPCFSSVNALHSRVHCLA